MDAINIDIGIVFEGEQEGVVETQAQLAILDKLVEARGAGQLHRRMGAMEQRADITRRIRSLGGGQCREEEKQ